MKNKQLLKIRLDETNVQESRPPVGMKLMDRKQIRNKNMDATFNPLKLFDKQAVKRSSSISITPAKVTTDFKAREKMAVGRYAE